MGRSDEAKHLLNRGVKLWVLPDESTDSYLSAQEPDVPLVC